MSDKTLNPAPLVRDLDDLIAAREQRDRFREHSIALNHLSWRLAEAVGDVPEGAGRIEGDPEEQLTRLIAERDRLRAGIEALADEWEFGLGDTAPDPVGKVFAGPLRALLSTDDEKERA